MEKILIVINGPPGIGKSWLATHIVEFLEERFSEVRIARFALRDIIWNDFKDLNNITMDYEEYKSTVFDAGVTGRDLIIRFAEGKRAEDLHYFDRRYTTDGRFLESEIVINDSLRKPEELDWLLGKVPSLMTIVLAPDEQLTWSQFKGDSGICLFPHGGFRTADSSAAFERFKSLVDNATFNADSVWFKLHLARSLDVKRD